MTLNKSTVRLTPGERREGVGVRLSPGENREGPVYYLGSGGQAITWREQGGSGVLPGEWGAPPCASSSGCVCWFGGR